MARRSQRRETRKTFVVLGDGITEQYYLKHLKEIKGYKYSIRPSLFERINFEKAERISAYPEVLICETMPSIEFWFLIHYEYTTSEFRNSGEVERRLRTYISDYSKSKSFLESRRWVENLMADNKLEKAKINSKRIIKRIREEVRGPHFAFSEVHNAINLFENNEESAR